MQPKILIIDDDEMIRKTLGYLLAQGGFESDHACDGFAAQKLMIKNDYDLALVDLRMPEMDGLDLLDWMSENVSEVVPIVLSGTTRIEDAAQAVQRGAFDFIQKPVESFEIFIQHVKRAIDRKRLTDSNKQLMEELQEKNVELENRFGQLEVAHSMLQSQALAIQVDLDRAMKIQQTLLPTQIPFEDRISLCALYRPSSKVGGDLFDIFKLDKDRIGLYIADTSGHGIASALLTMFLKHSIVLHSPENGGEDVLSPGDVLYRLNKRLISEEFGHDLFISMAYLILDTKTMEVCSSSAGHPSLLLKHQNGAIEPVHISAPALGINPNVVFAEKTFKLNPKDILLLHTDGLTEATNTDGDTFDIKKLLSVLTDSDSQVDSIVRGIEQNLLDFCGSRRFVDDITVLALGVEPQQKPFKTFRTLAGKEEKETEVPRSIGVATSKWEGHTFITVTGSGSWRESRQVLDLCTEANEKGEVSIIVDFTNCTHLDSTFLGVLHNLATNSDESDTYTFEIQNLPEVLMGEISELGLTNLLMHCRPEPLPLPESLQHIEKSDFANEEMGRLCLWAHEALVKADPTNADRFAAVLQALHQEIDRDKF